MAEAVSTKLIVEKLNIKCETQVYLHAGFEPEFLPQIADQIAEAKSSDVLLLQADQLADLDAISKLAAKLKPAGGLWIIYPKGKTHIRERDVMEAGLGNGLVDNKVVSFSATHTGLRFVIPLAKRPKKT